MYWQDNQEGQEYVVPDDIVDMAFTIACRCLPVGHAYALWHAIQPILPWLSEEKGAGIHPMHVADSGNGWMRPENPDDLLYLSHRTKLMLRIPKGRIKDSEHLVGQTVAVAGNELRIEQAAVRPLSRITTLFSRYVVIEQAVDEKAFMAEAAAKLKAIDINPKKMLCGMEKFIATPEKKIRARGLMIADITVEESVRLQSRGLGPLRYLGCGLFVPHKDINEVKQMRG